MKERIGKYLDAEQWPALPGRATSRWGIYSVSGKGLLGTVAWYGPWRQYTFDPEAHTTYNVACLQDIARFLAAQNEAHRQKAGCAPGGDGTMKCENCGAETPASINGHPFCNKKKCIEATVKGATALGRELRKLIERAHQRATPVPGAPLPEAP